MGKKGSAESTVKTRFRMVKQQTNIYYPWCYFRLPPDSV